MHGDDAYRIGTATRGLSLDVPVALEIDDHRRHLHVIGRTGTGKSTLLMNLMLADLYAGRGFALLDPHGDLATALIDAVPPVRTADVIYMDPADLDHPVGFNPMDRVPADRRPLVAAQLVAAFKHLFVDSWGPRLEYVLLNALRLLLDARQPSLIAMPRLFVDEAYRGQLLRTCPDPIVRLFWTQVFTGYGERFASEVLSPVQNKVGAVLAVPALRNILGQQRSTIDVRRIMDSGRVLIVNLAKGRLGEGPAHLLGAFLATAFAQAAESRSEVPEEERRDFHLVADEFQNFATDSFASILSEARKWRLRLTLCHQYLAQVSPGLRQAVLANAGSLVVFRCGAADAEVLAPEFGFESTQALTDIPNFTAWAKLLRGGMPDDPARVETDYPAFEHRGRDGAVVRRTRARHTRPRRAVEKSIERMLGLP
ncbi:MAG: type IV secretory system conjugative DNA transfer family protein [Hyphomicrobiaceae bacterium]